MSEPNSLADNNSETAQFEESPGECAVNCVVGSSVGPDLLETTIVDQSVGKLQKKSGASLYCWKNGHSHGALLDFGIRFCPACDADLSRPRHDFSQNVTNPQSDLSDDNSDDLQARLNALRCGSNGADDKSLHLNGARHTDENSLKGEEPLRRESTAQKSAASEPIQKLQAEESRGQMPIRSLDKDIPAFLIDEPPIFYDEPPDSFNKASQPVEPSKPAYQSVDFQDWRGRSVETHFWDGERSDLVPLAASTRLGESQTVIESLIVVRSDLSDDDLRKEQTRGTFLNDTRLRWTYHGTTLIIRSQIIVDAINAVASFSLRIPETAPVTLIEPYAVIGYNFEALKQHLATLDSTDQAPDSAARTDSPTVQSRIRQHGNTLFEWLQSLNYEERLSEEAERNGRGLCTFRMLWLLFRPGTTVFMESDGLISGYVVESISPRGTFSKRSELGLLSSEAVNKLKYVVVLWNLRSYSNFIGRVRRTITIGFFQGEMSISALKIVPMNMLNSLSKVCSVSDLENWGRKWFEAYRGRQIYYKGTEVGHRAKIEGRGYLDGNIFLSSMPDPAETMNNETYDDDDYDYQPRDWRSKTIVKCPCDQCRSMRVHPLPGDPWCDYDVIDPEKVDSLELADNPNGRNHRYLVCDRRIPALMLKTRRWVIADIACCQEPMFNEEALKTLVMPEQRKSLIMALVSKFKGTRAEDYIPSWRADAIEGKGEGTIFLLHGGPGVGKTFTAECIAEFTRRPLISLTSADIGTVDKDVETKLGEWLGNAERWGAVLLIDEADVYLETRRSSDLQRNSLVSVFLRCLEYYRGILFLTTNRVGQFDDAFISRVHVVIKYEPLGEHERRQIWTNYFNKLEKDRPNLIVNASALEYAIGEESESLCKLVWNGREIRNAFQTAIALADFRAQTESNSKVVLRTNDLQQVSKMTQSFKNYLKDVHGGLTEDQRAYVARTRFNPDDV